MNEYNEDKFAEWKARKKEEKEQAFQYADEMAMRVLSYNDTPVAIKTLLEIIARFPKLSITNALILYGKFPRATEIGSFKYWNEERDTRINKGEKGFALIEQGKDYVRADGKTSHYYTSVLYFDISQTHLKNSTNIINPTVEPEVLRQALISVTTARVRKITPKDEFSDMVNGMYYPESSVIVMRDGLNSNDFFSELAIQVALSLFDRGGMFFPNDFYFDACCVAYLVCSRWNVATEEFTFPNVPRQYSEYDSKDFIQKLKEIKRTADKINLEMYKSIQNNQQYKYDVDTKTTVQNINTMEGRYV